MSVESIQTSVSKSSTKIEAYGLVVHNPVLYPAAAPATSGRQDTRADCGQPEKQRPLSVAESYALWLKKYDDLWRWYCHFTFRLGNTKHGSIHPERANRIFHQFIVGLNQKIFGKKYRKNPSKGILVVRSTEIGDLGGLLHYHALFGRIPDHIQRMEYKEIWNDIAGFARIYPYDSMLGGAYYLSKSAYAWKRGEIDFIGPWDYADEIMRESTGIPAMFAAVGTSGSVNN